MFSSRSIGEPLQSAFLLALQGLVASLERDLKLAAQRSLLRILAIARRSLCQAARPPALGTTHRQLWRADIPYIRLHDEFVFLAVILDAYLRRVIGWALDRTMEGSLTLAALRIALDVADRIRTVIFVAHHCPRKTRQERYLI